MSSKLFALFPTTLKNRLFLAFVMLILLPYAFLNVYNFNSVEGVLRKQTADQSLDQMTTLQKSLEDLLNVVYKTVTLMEQDVLVTSILREPNEHDSLRRVYMIDTKFKSIINSLFISLSPVYYTLLDGSGNVYASYTPNESLSYSRLTQEPWYTSILQEPYRYVWNWDKNYVSRDLSRSPQLLTYSTPLRDRDGTRYAVMRASVDVYEWFRAVTQFNEETYLLLEPDGTILADSKSGRIEKTERLAGGHKLDHKGYYVEGEYLHIYTELPRINKYMMKRVQMNQIYAEVDRLKKSFFTASFTFTLAFITITLLIASTITKPLHNLQRKMANAVDNRFRVQLPESKYQGEILQLTRTFNQMMADMEQLIQRLKEEERNKEAVRFQMLLSQTNPHFLLNTLNTVKWLALVENQPDIAEICVSLGKLLEAGLNSERELIYLKDELGLVESYIYIQNFRYKQLFDVQYEVEPGLEYALLPKLSLQPLVENSIQHGFMEREQKGLITIRAYGKEGKLYLEVEDNGSGSVERPTGKTIKSDRQRGGIGISNLKERLGLLFKSNAGLEMVVLEQGTRVRFYFPLLISEPYIDEHNMSAQADEG
ncbi:cache domain-containing sensor histidine kinase [Paenibacillus periandrae]|uniref:cache domain-containing sensor histidine kinase n=1 Tax=Paenibacillus periandrae TaxID=1761741 RepID=UPI001F094486